MTDLQALKNEVIALKAQIEILTKLVLELSKNKTETHIHYPAPTFPNWYKPFDISPTITYGPVTNIGPTGVMMWNNPKFEVRDGVLHPVVPLTTFGTFSSIYDGANCSCSPIGMPHSVECKGWNMNNLSYEHVCENKLGQPSVISECIKNHGS